MKCPKCGYNSFDYNQVCPKCNKDISTVQQKMNLPTFFPDPPSFLGALIGDEDMPMEDYSEGDTSSMEVEHEEELSLDEPTAMVEEDIDIEEEQDFELSLDDDALDMNGSQEIEISLDDESFDLLPGESEGEIELEQEENRSLKDESLAIDLDAEDIVDLPSMDSPVDEIPQDLMDLSEEDSVDATPELEEEELSLDLGDLSFEDLDATSTITPEMIQTANSEQEIELETSNVEDDLPKGDDLSDELSLDFSDLADEEPGESEAGVEEEPEDLAIDLGEIAFDELDSWDKKKPHISQYDDSEMVTVELDKNGLKIPQDKDDTSVE